MSNAKAIDTSAGFMPVKTIHSTSGLTPPQVGEHIEIGRHGGWVCARYRITAVHEKGAHMYELDLHKVLSVSTPIPGRPGYVQGGYVDAEE
jgi:hypothetical protein